MDCVSCGRAFKWHLKGQAVRLVTSINEMTRIKAYNSSRRQNREQWWWQAIAIGNRNLRGKHALVCALINSLCGLHRGIELSGISGPRVPDFTVNSLSQILTFTVSESLHGVLELRLKVLAPNHLHPPGVDSYGEGNAISRAKISIAHKVDAVASDRLRNVARDLF